jgi:membrane protease YdiL (CAAX protease family)
MLNQWFYSHTTWQVGSAVCLVLILIPLAGLFIFHRLVPWRYREEDTAMVGLSYALCGGLYAVMLAFVAVGTYETMDRSATIASDEANSLGGIAFDSAGLPAELAVRVREDVDRYIDIVTKKEWPSQQAYRMEARNYEEGWAQMRRISLDLASFEPATQGQATVKAELEHVVNDLFAERRTRLLAAKAHLPDAVWQMLIFGLGLVAIYVFLFGPHSYKIHMAVTALTMLSIGLVFTLVIALDYPFRGDVSVDSDAYIGVKEVAERVFHPKEAAPARGGEHPGTAGKEASKEK